MVNRVSKDNTRLEGLVGSRFQNIFNKMNWNTTYIIDSLAGVYIPENKSYNGNIGLLERNLIDIYFAPNSVNVLTRRIGLTSAITSNELLVMLIVDPLKYTNANDITNVNMDSKFWIFNMSAVILLTIITALIFLKSYSFILKLLNKKLTIKNFIDLLLTANFYVITMCLEQLKNQDRSQSFMRFIISFIYIGMWCWNRLVGGGFQTESIKIDTSKIITTFEQTLKSNYQACLIDNEPLTVDFLSNKKLRSMFPFHPRHLYKSQLTDILNFIREYKTKALIATSIFVRSVGWSACSYFRDEIGLRKVFIPEIIVDEDIAVYYYSLKSDKNLIEEIKKKFTFGLSENQLISYMRNPYMLNTLQGEVQHFCVVRNLKVLTDQVHRGASLDHHIKLESYSYFMRIYFIFITCILIISLIIFLIHYIKIKIQKNQTKNRFLIKLGNKLDDEILLDDHNLNRNQLDRLYVNIDTITGLIKSKEFYNFLNPFHIGIINEEYQLMRLKYKIIKNKIEDKILKLDGHFQLNRNSITQLNLMNNKFLYKSSQKDVLMNLRFNQELRNYLHPYNENSNVSINLLNKPNLIEFNQPVELDKTNDHLEVSKISKINNHLNKQSIYWQKLKENLFNLNKLEKKNKIKSKRRIRIQDDPYLFKYDQFKYALPNNLDLVIKKYNKH